MNNLGGQDLMIKNIFISSKVMYIIQMIKHCNKNSTLQPLFQIELYLCDLSFDICIHVPKYMFILYSKKSTKNLLQQLGDFKMDAM